MKTVELFCGTKSFSKVAYELGHETYTIDHDERHSPDIVGDILKIQEFPKCDIIWASPPCEGFSVAVIGRNWNHDYTPKHARAKLAMDLALRTIDIIRQAKPKYWFIENPRGMLRKMPFMDAFLAEQGGGKTHSDLLPIW